MRVIKRIGEEDFAEIFEKYLVNDFPENERRSLKAIRKTYESGNFFCLAYYDGDTLLAYAGLIKSPNENLALLEYFAVMEAGRGGGIGSAFFEDMKAELTDLDGLILECENPTKTSDEAEKKIRIRRISFYERLGVDKSNIGFKILTADYQLLWLKIKKDLSEVDMVASLKEIYTLSYPKLVVNLMTSSYEIK